jgi:spheroidene monooxygenase
MVMAALTGNPAEARQVVTLSVFRFRTPGARLWAFAMMGLARRRLRRLTGGGFWKLLGTGTGAGFTPIPNTAVYAILAAWPALSAARAAQQDSLFARYRAKAAESLTLYLAPISARGLWAGTEPFRAGDGRAGGPLAALTRATVKPSALLRFWRRVPDIQAAIAGNPDVLFRIGLGEVPWLHQVTFSVWPDAESMARFARGRTHHAEAIRAVRDGHWFREELYARFDVIGREGRWEGRDPFART